MYVCINKYVSIIAIYELYKILIAPYKSASNADFFECLIEKYDFWKNTKIESVVWCLGVGFCKLRACNVSVAESGVFVYKAFLVS